MDETTLAEFDTELRQKLTDLQKSGRFDKRSLVYKNPQKWLQVAADIVMGKSSKMIRDNYSLTYLNYKMIEREMHGSIEKYREIEAQRTEIAYSMTTELAMDKMARLKEAGEFDDKDAAAVEKIVKAGTLLHGGSTRLRGGADKVIETRTAKTPEEIKKEFEDMFKKADVIDVKDDDE